MIDFRISEHPWKVSEISNDELFEKFQGKVDLDLIKLITLEQENLEVTYTQKEDIYRFDNVSIDKLLTTYGNKNEICMMDENFNYELIANIDVDLQNNRVVFLHLADGIGGLLDSDIHPEELKLSKINEFKQMQKDIKELGFYLEQSDIISKFSLVCPNPHEINLEKLSKAVSIADNFSVHDYEMFLDCM